MKRKADCRDDGHQRTKESQASVLAPKPAAKTPAAAKPPPPAKPQKKQKLDGGRFVGGAHNCDDDEPQQSASLLPADGLPERDVQRIAEQLGQQQEQEGGGRGVQAWQVKSVLQLLAQGSSVPFIAR